MSMNFIGAVLRTVDGFWALLAIPCLVVVGLFFVNAFPIPTALGFYGLIWMILDSERMTAQFKSKEEASKSRAESVGWATIIFIAAVVSFGICAYLQITYENTCEQTSPIPLTYNKILRFFSVVDC